MSDQIEIDPNVRVNHNRTIAYVDSADDYVPGDAHVVIEPESGITWPATIHSVHSTGEQAYLELEVAWGKWKSPARSQR